MTMNSRQPLLLEVNALEINAPLHLAMYGTVCCQLEKALSGRLEYLEIVDVVSWRHPSPGNGTLRDQLQPFIDHLARHSMTLAWGKMPR